MNNEPGLRTVLRELAQHPGGVHSSNPALARWDSSQIGKQARQLAKLGQLFSAKITRRNARYFSTAAARDAFVERYAATERRRGARVVYEAADRAPWPADAPAVITERTRFTVCPAFVPRFREHTFSFVHRGLQ